VQSTTTITPVRAGKPAPTESAEDSACLIFDRVFADSGTNRLAVLTAFECTLVELPQTIDREDRLRDIAKAAALSTARSHGNIIETGRTLLGNIDELGAKLSLDIRRSKEQVMLGLAEGACQVGPIVYGRFLDIASEYRDNADEWIAKNKRRIPLPEIDSLPVIVPFEAELTLSTKPFKDSSAPTAVVEPANPAEAITENQPVEAECLSDNEVAASPEGQWSRPKGKGFFRRLSDVMGSLFGRN
jgi:hypothetical protein